MATKRFHISDVLSTCGPDLLRQFPHLADADKGRDWQVWTAEAARVHGEWFDVAPLSSGTYEPNNPIEELVEKVGESKVVVVRHAR
jgi:hypothetical protein